MTPDQRRVVLYALCNCAALTDWEWDFVNRLADQDEADPGKELSERQVEILDRISQTLDTTEE